MSLHPRPWSPHQGNVVTRTDLPDRPKGVVVERSADQVFVLPVDRLGEGMEIREPWPLAVVEQVPVLLQPVADVTMLDGRMEEGELWPTWTMHGSATVYQVGPKSVYAHLTRLHSSPVARIVDRKAKLLETRSGSRYQLVGLLPEEWSTFLQEWDEQHPEQAQATCPERDLLPAPTPIRDLGLDPGWNGSEWSWKGMDWGSAFTQAAATIVVPVEDVLPLPRVAETLLLAARLALRLQAEGVGVDCIELPRGEHRTVRVVVDTCPALLTAPTLVGHLEAASAFETPRKSTLVRWSLVPGVAVLCLCRESEQPGLGEALQQQLASQGEAQAPF